MRIINEVIKDWKNLNKTLDTINKDAKNIQKSMQVNGFILDKLRDGGLHVRTSDAKDN